MHPSCNKETGRVVWLREQQNVALLAKKRKQQVVVRFQLIRRESRCTRGPLLGITGLCPSVRLFARSAIRDFQLFVEP